MDRREAAGALLPFEEDEDDRWFLSPFYDWPAMRVRREVQKLGSHLVRGYNEAASEGSREVAKWSWMIQRFNEALAKEDPGIDLIEAA